MKILVVDECIWAELDDALRKLGHKVLYILNHQALESHIDRYKPAMVLIGSNSKAYDSLALLMDIKDRYVYLPVLIYNNALDDFIDDLLPLVRSTLCGLAIYGGRSKKEYGQNRTGTLYQRDPSGGI